jgi:hypothetical protein
MPGSAWRARLVRGASSASDAALGGRREDEGSARPQSHPPVVAPSTTLHSTRLAAI